MNGSVRTIGRDVGKMLQALAGLVAVTVLVAVVWGELWAVPGLLVSAAVPLAVGRLLVARCREADEPGKLHGMMIAATGWLAVAVFGALPFLAVAWTIHLDPAVLGAPDLAGRAASTVAAFRSPLNALFESMSGFTGTGLTMTDDESALPATLQWWRTFSEWVGGVGVIVLTTAILARPGSGSPTLYESEARSEKIHPSIVSTVRTIWWIFLLFTFGAIALLWLAGMPLWDAINHGMTGLATGGFSITDNSIATYDSAVIDAALIPVMVAGSIAFPVHYLMLRGDLRNVYRDLQTRWVAFTSVAGSAALWLLLTLDGTYGSALRTLRYAGFQFVSAFTCTGFQTAVDATNVAIRRWPAEGQLAVVGAMVVGGAAGSTVGGIKLIRALTLVRGVRYRIADVFHPDSAVRYLQMGDRRLAPREVSREFDEAAIVAVLWIVFLTLGLAVLLVALPDGAHRLEHAMFEVASAQGNVGLSAGITGPGMPELTKLTFTFNMWIGRLEIVPVLVLLRGVLARGGLYR